LHLNEQQDFWNNVFWTDKTNVETVGHNAQQHVWQKPKTQTPHTNCIPNHSKVKWEAICLTAKAWVKLVDV